MNSLPSIRLGVKEQTMFLVIGTNKHNFIKRSVDMGTHTCHGISRTERPKTHMQWKGSRASIRPGNYEYKTDSTIYQISIVALAKNDKFEVLISSTDGIELKANGFSREGHYDRIEGVCYNGKTVQIRTEDDGHSISCSLFGNAKLQKCDE
jgi:hypothetical protein